MRSEKEIREKIKNLNRFLFEKELSNVPLVDGIALLYTFRTLQWVIGELNYLPSDFLMKGKSR